MSENLRGILFLTHTVYYITRCILTTAAKTVYLRNSLALTKMHIIYIRCGSTVINKVSGSQLTREKSSVWKRLQNKQAKHNCQ